MFFCCMCQGYSSSSEFLIRYSQEKEFPDMPENAGMTARKQTVSYADVSVVSELVLHTCSLNNVENCGNCFFHDHLPYR